MAPPPCALSPRCLLGYDYESSAEHQVFHSLSHSNLTEQQQGWKAHNMSTPTQWGRGNRRKTTQASNGVFHQVCDYQAVVFYSRKTRPLPSWMAENLVFNVLLTLKKTPQTIISLKTATLKLKKQEG